MDDSTHARSRSAAKILPVLLERAVSWPLWGHWSVPAAAGTVAAFSFGDIRSGLVVACLGYIAGEAAQSRRLGKWLASPGLKEPPPLRGSSGRLAQRIDTVRRRWQDQRDTRGFLLKNMHSFIRHLPNAIILLDQQHRIEWANKPAKRLLGIRWPRDAGIRFTHLLRHPDMVSALRYRNKRTPNLRLAIAREPDTILEFRIMTRVDGRVVVFARDASGALRLERMRQDFVANASHELRTPLTVLSGMTELLLTEADEMPKAWRPKLESIADQVGYMRRLTDDLLRLSLLDDPYHQNNDADGSIDVIALCHRVADEMSGLAGRHQLSLRVEADGSAALRGRESEIHCTLLNLVSNSIRYTEPGGRIVVRWSADTAGGRLEVMDNGVGIAARHIPRLTERFYRAEPSRDRSRGGAGLGLAIVRQVLERHQATLRVYSTPGQGSRFACLFPGERLCQRDAASQRQSF